MKFILMIAAVIAAVWLFGYIRIFCKRAHLALKVRRACSENQLKLIPHGPLWWLGLNRSKACDFTIEGENDIYSVKLFAVRGRTSILQLATQRLYSVRRRITFFGRFNSASMTLASSVKKMPEYRFTTDSNKKTHKILLFNPVPLEIQYMGPRGAILGDGDEYCGMTVMSAKCLIQRISNK